LCQSEWRVLRLPRSPLQEGRVTGHPHYQRCEDEDRQNTAGVVHPPPLIKYVFHYLPLTSCHQPTSTSRMRKRGWPRHRLPAYLNLSLSHPKIATVPATSPPPPLACKCGWPWHRPPAHWHLHLLHANTGHCSTSHQPTSTSASRTPRWPRYRPPAHLQASHANAGGHGTGHQPTSASASHKQHSWPCHRPAEHSRGDTSTAAYSCSIHIV
jgi:hypothetical protein